ncbi:hypothetical protein TNCV_2824951 [Trichonephila clavipes]|nr:hypothetical protein TNCV_2824951 [Trichonephila clavipes]
MFMYDVEEELESDPTDKFVLNESPSNFPRDKYAPRLEHDSEKVARGKWCPGNTLWPTLRCRRVAGVSPPCQSACGTESPKRHCCRVSAADKGCRVYPLDPHPDAVSLYLWVYSGLVLPNLSIDETAQRVRYLIISLPNNAMSVKSPFTIHKALKGIGGEPKSIKRFMIR